MTTHAEASPSKRSGVVTCLKDIDWLRIGRVLHRAVVQLTS